MVIKKWFEKLKRGVKGELVRDYSSLTKKDDRLDAKLIRVSDGFELVMTVTHHEHGKADFKAPVNAETFHVLNELLNDLKSVRSRPDKYKETRLRFRDGEIDLVVTYKHSHQVKAPRQRTTPVNSRILNLFQEIYSDAETLLDSELTADEIGDY